MGFTMSDIKDHIKARGIHVGKVRVDIVESDIGFEDGETFFFVIKNKYMSGTTTNVPLELIKSRKQFLEKAVDTHCDFEINYLSQLSFDLKPKQKLMIYLFPALPEPDQQIANDSREQ